MSVRYSLILSFCLFYLVFPPAGLLAQQQYGELVVRVSDQTGGVLPGCMVVMTSPALIRPVEGVSDSSGVFRYPVLPPGVYQITVAAPGFTTSVQEGVKVDLGRTYTLTFSLEIAGIVETVTVEATSPMVDTVKSESVGVFDREELSKAPGARDYTQFAMLMPSVNIDPMSGATTRGKCVDCGQTLGIGGAVADPSGNPQGAAVSVDGASGAENVFYVDGIDTTGMFSGMPNQGVRADLVQELQIKTAGYEAQFGGAMGGVMSVVTRSGGNQLSGSAFYHYDGSALSGKPRPRLRLDPYSAVDVAEYVQDPEDSHRRHELGFTLGGPIFRDRAWFFGSVIPQYGETSRDVEFVSGEEGSYTRNDRTINFLGKVDVQPHQTLRLTGLYTSDAQRQEGGLPGRDGTGNPDFNWEEERYNYPSRTYMATASFIPSTDFIMDGRFGLNHIGGEQLLEPPGVRHHFNVSNGVIGFSPDHPLYRPRFWAEFPSTVGVFLERDDQDKSTFSVSASYYFSAAGQHTLKAGYQFNRLSHDLNQGYRFDYISYAFGRVYNKLDGTTAISSCTGPDGVVYTPCGYYAAFHPYGNVSNIHTDRHAIYIQDGWILGDRLSLNAGLRFEKEAIPSFDDLTGASIPVFEWGFGDKVAPRLGGSWDVLGDGTLKAFGSWGRFYDAMKLGLAQGYFGGRKVLGHAYLLDDSNLDWTQHGGLNGEGPFPGPFIESVNFGYSFVDDLDPELRPMRMTDAVAGLEWELRADTRWMVAAHLLAGVAEARAGNLEAARTELESLREVYRPEEEEERMCFYTLEGEIALAAGDPDSAEVAFYAGEPTGKLNMFSAYGLFANTLPSRDGPARVKAARGDLEGGIDIYRELNTPDMRNTWTVILEPRFVLEVARLLDQKGDTSGARLEYRRFLELWKDADPGLPELDEARRYLGSGVNPVLK